MTGRKSPRFSKRFYVLSVLTLLLLGVFYRLIYPSFGVTEKSGEFTSRIEKDLISLRNFINRKKIQRNQGMEKRATTVNKDLHHDDKINNNYTLSDTITNINKINSNTLHTTNTKKTQRNQRMEKRATSVNTDVHHDDKINNNTLSDTITDVNNINSNTLHTTNTTFVPELSSSFPTQPSHTKTRAPTTVIPQTTESDVLLMTYKPNIYGDISSCPKNSNREILSELFKHWVSLAKEHQIEYVIFYGTLLGALRNGDLIPWDSDMDLLLDVKYWPLMLSLASKRNFSLSDGKIRLVVQPEFMKPGPSTGRKRYTCDGRETPVMVDSCSFQEPLARLIKGGRHIDFYHFYDRGTRLQDDSEEFTRFYDKKDFFPLKKCHFMSIETLCPRNPWPPLQVYFKSNKITESPYRCVDGEWVKENT